ncbi:DUF4149 domain-containing protein [Campylobacter sp. RM16192]|uniref:DUF4149 domain-containing protein n=1 Tax=Campylobacter sp. RM16192 TaxID=1660080 RepID=UPI001451CDD0|nr:DUF4149 domain-containing protein [Campylobacter sp. RM16192]QCD52370.1 hypothetical membrane protein (DUF4149 domain) [Campylobacter sp. RM16192]
MKALYLLLLAALIGIEASIGAFVAPTIFYPQNILGQGVLTHFQSGLLMTNIFVKFNYVLLFISIMAIVYEIFAAKFEKNSHFALKFSSFALSFINLALAAAFVFYFTPYILDAQKLGVSGTTTAEFVQVHKASELVMKIMMFAQILLFFIKFPRQARA